MKLQMLQLLNNQKPHKEIHILLVVMNQEKKEDTKAMIEMTVVVIDHNITEMVAVKDITTVVDTVMTEVPYSIGSYPGR